MKTAFVMPTRNYHYKVMPFGLKNAGSTNQRMMTRMFEPQLGKNIEIYVDDMVVKSKVVSDHLGDLGDIFDVLRRHKLLECFQVLLWREIRQVSGLHGHAQGDRGQPRPD